MVNIGDLAITCIPPHWFSLFVYVYILAFLAGYKQFSDLLYSFLYLRKKSLSQPLAIHWLTTWHFKFWAISSDLMYMYQKTLTLFISPMLQCPQKYWPIKADDQKIFLWCEWEIFRAFHFQGSSAFSILITVGVLQMFVPDANIWQMICFRPLSASTMRHYNMQHMIIR